MLEVSMAVWPAEVTETAAKPSPVPLQKHWPGGCTVDMSISNYHSRGTCRFVVKCLVGCNVVNCIHAE